MISWKVINFFNNENIKIMKIMYAICIPDLMKLLLITILESVIYK